MTEDLMEQIEALKEELSFANGALEKLSSQLKEATEANEALETQLDELKYSKTVVQAMDTDELDLRIMTNANGNCIQVAWWRGDELAKVVWEPARTWTRN